MLEAAPGRWVATDGPEIRPPILVVVVIVHHRPHVLDEPPRWLGSV